MPKLVGVAAPTLRPVNPAPQPKKQRAHTSPVPLFTTKQLASTRIRSVVPAPINTVLVRPAVPGRAPIIVLLAPVVISQPLLPPMAILIPPVVLLRSAKTPIAILQLLTLAPNEHRPMAILRAPVLFVARAKGPTATLLPPVVLATNEHAPTAILHAPMVLAHDA